VNNVELIRDCLALRHHTLGLFAGTLDAESWVRSVSATQPRALWLLLAAEACATPIRGRVGAAARALPDEQRALLERASAEELQRMLAARMQLAVIDRAAAAAGVNPIVLKGGVPIAEGKNSFDLGDVDIFLDDAGCKSMARALEDIGGDGQGSVYFRDGFHVELHSGLDVGRGVKCISRMASRPIRGYTHLHRLEHVEHVAYVVQHATTHHPHRRSNLRDLLLLADALRDCNARELGELTDRLRANPERRLYLRALSAARSVSSGTRSEDDAATALIAAANYAFGLRWPDSAGPVQQLARGMVAFFFGTASDVGRAIGIYLLSRTTPRSYWLRHPFARRAPRLSMIMSYIVRTPYRVALLLYAAAVATAFRLDFDRHLWRPERGG
jgi:putative nucleotidyltransferase-like protein